MSSITTNVPSLFAQRSLSSNLLALNTSFNRLATGFRINRGADDPAGLIASENLRAALEALEGETRVLERSRSVIDTADAALGEIDDLLVEAEGLAVANANTGGLSEAEREANQLELDSILQSVDRIASSTEFNGDPLLDGSADINLARASISIDSAAVRDLGAISVDGQTYDLADVETGGAISISGGDTESAQAAIAAARSQVASQRGALGAFSQNTIDSRLDSLGVAVTNVTQAESVIRATDYAFEFANAARFSALADAARFTLAGANAQPSNALELLG